MGERVPRALGLEWKHHLSVFGRPDSDQVRKRSEPESGPETDRRSCRHGRERQNNWTAGQLACLPQYNLHSIRLAGWLAD